MKTAEEWCKELRLNHSYDQIVDANVIERIQLDAYRAGMLRAAALVQITPIYSDNPMETDDQKFHRICDTFEHAILTAANSLKPEVME